MGQTAMTVRLDSEVKKKFDDLCLEFGMSANTAFTIFVNAVIRSRSIPFAIEVPKCESSQSRAMRAVEYMRETAAEAGVAEMSLEEINEEIRKSREERKSRK